MTTKAKTINLQGKEYATVPERLRLFREANPNGLIETIPEMQENGSLIFKARVLKDKAKPESGEATGHSMGKLDKEKSFEKLETISIGRALAILGYLAAGEIASSEEMEAFNEYKEQQIQEAIDMVTDTKDLDELKAVFKTLGTMLAEPKVIEAKDKRKGELTDEVN